LNQPLLAQIPLETSIREGSDTGQPVAVTGIGEAADLFRQIADEIVRRLEHNK